MITKDLTLAHLHELAKVAKADQEPWFEDAIRALAHDPDPQLAADLVEMLQPAAVEEMLNPVPFAIPSVRHYAEYIDTPNPIIIGKIRNTSIPFWPPIDKFNRGCVIVGAPGTGKSNLLFGIVPQAIRYCNVTIIDRNKQDFRHATQFVPNLLVFNTKSTFAFNPFQVPPGVDPRDHITAAIEIFLQGNDLLGLSTSVALPAGHELYRERGIFDGSEDYPTLRDYHHTIESLKYKGYAPRRQAQDRILARLEAYLTANPEMYDCQKGFSIPDLAARNYVLEVKSDDEAHCRVLVSWLARFLFNYRMANHQRGNVLRNLFIVDECRYLVPPVKNPSSPHPPIASILQECREAGISWIFASQGPDLHKAVFQNQRMLVCFSLASGEDRKIFQTHAGLSDEQRDYLTKLKTGHACVRIPGVDSFLIETPRVRLG